MRNLIFLLPFFAILSCSQKPDDLNGDQIIEKAIEAQGGKLLDEARVSFDFRGGHFSAKRKNGEFTLAKCSDLKCRDTVDVLSNTGFKRTISGKPVSLPDSLKASYGNQVNSVHYFAVLPYGLDGAAVKKELVGTATVKGRPYYKVKVGFEEEGGGTDHEDEYMYWVNRDNFNVDYLAYNYEVSEGGTRFREAYNARTINGVRLVDYRNFVPKEQYPPLKSLDSLFEKRKLELLSVIELKNISITRCPDC